MNHLVPGTPSTLVRRLWDARDASDHAINLSLVLSGTSYTGRLVGLSDESTPSVALELSSSGVSGQLLFAPLGSIEAVIVHDPSIHASVLTEGRVPDVAQGEPPSKLALSRTLKEVGEGSGLALNVSADWESVPTEPASMHQLGLLAHALKEALQELGVDSMGRDALKNAKAIMIEHQNEATLGATARSEGLLLQVDLQRALPRSLKKGIVDALSEVL